MKPALSALTSIATGNCCRQDVINLAMTSRLSEYVERYIRAPMPKRPQALKMMLDDCIVAINNGETAVVYEDDVKQVRRWIQQATRVLAQQRPERVHDVLTHIRDGHAIRVAISGRAALESDASTTIEETQYDQAA